jgi:PHD and RING finger domain-containing protein 1
VCIKSSNLTFCILSDWETEEDTEEEEEEDGDDDDEEEDDESSDDSGEETEDYEYEEEEEGGEGETCPICLDRLRDQDVGTPESCDHTFCLECIQEWSKVASRLVDPFTTKSSTDVNS